MAFYESFKTKNGGFITVEWTLGEYAAAKIVGVVVAIYFLGFFALIIPTLWLLIYFISIEEHRPMINVVAILSSIYLLFDYHYGLVCWSFIISFFGEKAFNIVIFYSTSLMLVHAVLLLFGRKIFFYIKGMSPDASDSSLLLTFFIYTIIMCIGGYFLGEMLISTFLTQKPFPYPTKAQ